MQDINTIITTNFNENISYFEKYQPQLFSKLSALDSAIVNGHYEEQYELVYENSGFDVFERKTDTYLYAKESLAHTIISENSVNFKNDEELFEGHIRRSFSDYELNTLTKEKPLSNFLSELAPIIEFTNRNKSKQKELKSLDKFIFFGVGLGLHIEAIAKKINSKIYFIVEDDLELFRLSLFTVNYKKLAQNSTLLFSIFETKDEFMTSCAVFLDSSFYYNHYIKQFSLLSHSEDKKNQFLVAITSQPHIRFQFANLLKSYLAPLPYLFDEYHILQKEVSFDTPYLQDKSFLLLAMGPSLQKNIEWLKENHHNFITLAVSSTLSYLEKHEIVPDIIVHIDPFEWGIESFNKLKNRDFTKNSLCLFSTMTPPNIMATLTKEQLFLFESGTSYQTSSLKPSSPCVGSLTYQLLLILKAKNIYLLGLDLAVDSTTGKTHSGEHQSLKKLNIQENSFEESSISYKEALFHIDGNFTKKVQTTPDFYSSIFTIEYFTKLLKKNYQIVVNLSNGAKFSQTISKRVEEIKVKQLDSKINLHQNLLTIFRKNSQIGLSDIDLSNLRDKLNHAYKIKSYINAKADLKDIDIAGYLSSLYTKLAHESDMHNYELSRVLDTYLKYMLSYIYDFFNYKDIDMLNIDILDEMLKEHLNNIVVHYISSLEESLNAK